VAAALPADVYDVFVCVRVFVAEVHLWVLLGDLQGDLQDRRDQPVGRLPDLPGHLSDVGHPSQLNDPVRAGYPPSDHQAAGCSEHQRCPLDALGEVRVVAV